LGSYDFKERGLTLKIMKNIGTKFIIYSVIIIIIIISRRGPRQSRLEICLGHSLPPCEEGPI
jgi:hypothetical protein